MRIVEALNLRVHAESRKRAILKLLELPDSLYGALVEHPEDANLLIAPMNFLSIPKLNAFLKHHNRFSRCVGFRPTGWTWTGADHNKSQRTSPGKSGHQLSLRPAVPATPPSAIPSLRRQQRGSVVLYEVPYSEHSSFSELQRCVASVRPRYLVPTVGGFSSDKVERMKQFLNHNDRPY
mmetsp:Transcript_18598/g.39087  ORF Transcript_18598/g.39087 Transcript_18598/m.39087 type:complete len:179 (-) Transcript_18598:740-1276(-)